MNYTVRGLRPSILSSAALLLVSSAPAFAQSFPPGPVRAVQTPYVGPCGLSVGTPAPNSIGPLEAEEGCNPAGSPIPGAVIEFVPDAAGTSARIKTEYGGQTCYLAADYELPGYVQTLFPNHYDLKWDCTYDTVSWFDLTRIDAMSQAISKNVGNSTCGLVYVHNAATGEREAKLDCSFGGTPFHILAETTSVWSNEYVSAGLGVVYGPFPVVRHSAITASIVPTTPGIGDADLYVRFDSPPTSTDWDCRPYSSGSTESCSLTVPPTNVTSYYISVVGYSGYTEYELKTTRPEPQ